MKIVKVTITLNQMRPNKNCTTWTTLKAGKPDIKPTYFFDGYGFSMLNLWDEYEIFHIHMIKDQFVGVQF